jgi:hypothetical protein
MTSPFFAFPLSALPSRVSSLSRHGLRDGGRFPHSSFVIRHSSFVIRHSSFVIRHSDFALLPEIGDGRITKSNHHVSNSFWTNDLGQPVISNDGLMAL